MKKFSKLLIILCMALCCMFAFSACGKIELGQPEKLTLNESTLQVKWKEVDDARAYKLSIYNTETKETIEKDTRNNYFSLEFLDAGNYIVKVQSTGHENIYRNSKWSEELPFERKQESGLSYRLINGNTEYEVIGLGSAPEDVVVDAYFRNKPVTQIAAKAFTSNTKLKSIVIGENIKSIGERAFYNCELLESVTFDDGDTLTKLGNRVFQGCKALKSIAIPDTITTIGEFMFASCESLEEVTLPDITSIGAYAFYNCLSIREMTIPNSVESIGSNAFAKMVNLEKVDIGNKVVSIGESAFDGDTKLATVNFTATSHVETIGAFAFRVCTSLETITLPESVLEINEQAFQNCTALKTINLGSNIKYIGYGVFYNTKFINEAPEKGLIVVDEKWVIGSSDRGMEYLYYIDENGDEVSFEDSSIIGIAEQALYYPNDIEGDPAFNNFFFLNCPTSLKYINKYAFFGCLGIMELQMPNVEEIGEKAFAGCVNIDTVNFGSDLTFIGRYAFQACEKIGLGNTPIELPDTVTHIGTYAFYGTGAFKKGMESEGVVYIDDWLVCVDPFVMEVNIKEGTVGIADNSFFMCSVLGVTMPDTIKYIGYGAFAGCFYLGLAGPVELSENLEYVDDYSFYMCAMLSITEIPASVKSIGRSAFYNCLSLGNVVIPGTVKSIDKFAFYMSGVTNLIIEDGVESIGDRAFQFCPYLQSVNIAGSVKTINPYAFYSPSKVSEENPAPMLKSVTLGEGVEVIGEYAFTNATALEELNLPNSLVKIGKDAFRNASVLQSVKFGSGLKTIETAAFYECSNLKYIYLSGNIETIDRFAFRSCSDLESIIIESDIENIGNHVFYGCKKATIYITGEAQGEKWGNYWNSSSRPIIYGVTVTDGYVSSFTVGEDTFATSDAIGPFAAPRRAGYTFVGWSTQAGSETYEYTVETVVDVAAGTTLYSVWEEGEPIELPEETPEDGDQTSDETEENGDQPA